MQNCKICNAHLVQSHPVKSFTLTRAQIKKLHEYKLCRYCFAHFTWKYTNKGAVNTTAFNEILNALNNELITHNYVIQKNLK